MVCATAITAGGAVEVRKLTRDAEPARAKPAAHGKQRAAEKAVPAAAAAAAATSGPAVQHEFTRPHAAATAAAPAATRREQRPADVEEQPISSSYADPVDIPVPAVDVDAPVVVGDEAQPGSGGTAAPAVDEAPAVEGGTTDQPVIGQLPAIPVDPAKDGSTTTPPAAEQQPPPTGTTPLPPEH